MLSRQFLSWADGATAGERADAAGDLARAFLYAETDRIERGEMERAMTCLLDDASPLVRRSLAEALAHAGHAPHHLIAALANDQADIAAIVLGRSPILTDAELIDAAAVGEPVAQSAIAARAALSVAVAGALAEVGSREAVLALCRNDAADLADVSAHRILERFGDDAGMREALGGRRDIGAALRHDLVVATAETLRRFVTGCRWVAPERARRIASEASDRAAIALSYRDAEREGAAGQLRFAAYLRCKGHLTQALVLRALMSGRTALFEACLVELSGQPPSRVSGLVRRHGQLGFAALVRAAGLPDVLLPVFRAALDAGRASGPRDAATLRRDVIVHVLAQSGIDRGSPVAGLTALLRRFEVEAARDEGRAATLEHRMVGIVPAEPRTVHDARRRIEPRFEPVAGLAVAA